MARSPEPRGPTDIAAWLLDEALIALAVVLLVDAAAAGHFYWR